jgi:Flp pilus assembly protein TadD
VELAPADGEASFYLAGALANLGQPEIAIELTRQALLGDPLRANWYDWLAIYYLGLRRPDEAERAVAKAIELQPGAQVYHQTLTMIKVQRGDAPAALRAAHQEPIGIWQDVALAQALQIGDARAAADAALTTLIDKHADTSAYQIAEVYAIRNAADKTFKWLDRAWNNRDSGVGFLLYDAFILRYKDDPRFAAFCRKVGLPTPAEVRGRT